MLDSLEDIRKAIKESNNSEQKEVLKVLLGNVQNSISKEENKGKTLSQVINIEIKSLLKGINSTIEMSQSRGLDTSKYKSYLVERDTLEQYLPVYLSPEQTYELISSLEFKNIGEAMRLLKEHKDWGLVDKSLASTIINTIIKNKNNQN